MIMKQMIPKCGDQIKVKVTIVLSFRPTLSNFLGMPLLKLVGKLLFFGFYIY